MEHKSNGLSFMSPNHTTTFKHIMTGFVDDTTHWLNNFRLALHGQYSQYEMYMTTQQTAQWWEQSLHATSGKLELSKCFYYPIIWKFNDEGVPELSLNDEDRQVTIISSENGQPVTIKKKWQPSLTKRSGYMKIPQGSIKMNTRIFFEFQQNGKIRSEINI